MPSRVPSLAGLSARSGRRSCSLGGMPPLWGSFPFQPRKLRHPGMSYQISTFIADDGKCFDAFVHPVGFSELHKVSEHQMIRFESLALSALPKCDAASLDFRFSIEKSAYEMIPQDSLSLSICCAECESIPSPMSPSTPTARSDPSLVLLPITVSGGDVDR